MHLIEHAADVDSLDFRPGARDLAPLTQTTLSVDEYGRHDRGAQMRGSRGLEDAAELRYLLRATSNRQAAVQLVAETSIPIAW